MLTSRMFRSIISKCQNRYVLTKARCFLSNLSSVQRESDPQNSSLNQSISRPISTKISSDENNEWLWAYLREQKSFLELTEEQRRRVIEIGKSMNTAQFTSYIELNSLEMQTLRESGERVPDVVPDERWTELINSPLIEARKSIYGYGSQND